MSECRALTRRSQLRPSCPRCSVPELSMKHPRSLTALAGLLVILLAAGEARAGQTLVAVAANFTDPAKEIAAAFKQQTGHDAVLSFGSSGQLYAQITQQAPFQIMLSADAERPHKLVE